MAEFLKPSTFHHLPSRLNSQGSDLELRDMPGGKLYPQESFGPHGIMNDLIVEFQQYLTDWTTRVKQVKFIDIGLGDRVPWASTKKSEMLFI